MSDDIRYYRVSPRIWTANRHWSEDARTLALYLMTCPHRNMIGLFWLPKGYMLGDLGWDPERLEKPFRELVDDGVIDYDDDAQVVLLVKALKYDSPDNPNQVKGALRKLNEVPESTLDLRFQQSAERYSKPLAKQLPQRFTKGSTETRDNPWGNTEPATEPEPATAPPHARARPPDHDQPPSSEPDRGGEDQPHPAHRALDLIADAAPPDVSRRINSSTRLGALLFRLANAADRGWTPRQLADELGGSWQGVRDPAAALLVRISSLGDPPKQPEPWDSDAWHAKLEAEAADPNVAEAAIADIRNKLNRRSEHERDPPDSDDGQDDD